MEEAKEASQVLKMDIQTAPALANLDYGKPFHLYVAERSRYASAVLMQDSSTGKRPLAYYSIKLDNLDEELSPCYQGLTPAAFALKKESILTMSYPLFMYTSYQLHVLLTIQLKIAKLAIR